MTLMCHFKPLRGFIQPTEPAVIFFVKVFGLSHLPKEVMCLRPYTMRTQFNEKPKYPFYA